MAVIRLYIENIQDLDKISVGIEKLGKLLVRLLLSLITRNCGRWKTLSNGNKKHNVSKDQSYVGGVKMLVTSLWIICM